MNNWKDKFNFIWYRDDVKRKLYEGKLDKEYIIDFITQLLEEQRKESIEQAVQQLEGKVLKVEEQKIKQDLINQILSEAPKDRDVMLKDSMTRILPNLQNTGFNKCNAQWRKIISNISNNKLK